MRRPGDPQADTAGNSRDEGRRLRLYGGRGPSHRGLERRRPVTAVRRFRVGGGPTHEPVAARPHDQQRPEQGRRVQQHGQDDVGPTLADGRRRRRRRRRQASARGPTRPAPARADGHSPGPPRGPPARRRRSTSPRRSCRRMMRLGVSCKALAPALSRATAAVKSIRPRIENLSPSVSPRVGLAGVVTASEPYTQRPPHEEGRRGDGDRDRADAEESRLKSAGNRDLQVDGSGDQPGHPPPRGYNRRRPPRGRAGRPGRGSRRRAAPGRIRRSDAGEDRCRRTVWEWEPGGQQRSQG